MIPSFFSVKSKFLSLRNNMASCVYANMVSFLPRCDQHHVGIIYKIKPGLYLTSHLKQYNTYKASRSELDMSKGSNTTSHGHSDSGVQPTILKNDLDLGYFYLENLFGIETKEWFHFLTNAEDKETVLCLLTNFQRHIRHLKCRQLLYIIEKCNKYEIRENNESIDVYYVILCEVLYNFLKRNNRALCINDISRLCKTILKIKFNREFDCKSKVPICSCNFEFNNKDTACEKCKLRYGDLLNLNGGDLVTSLMVVLGKSILIQSKHLRKKHENLIVPYLVLVGSKNCTLSSNIVRQMSIQYQRQFISTSSIRNISILLHTIKRTGARAAPLSRRIVHRLSGEGVIEKLLDRELSTKAKLASISQIIQFCINTRDSGSNFNRGLDLVVGRTIRRSYGLFEEGGLLNIQQYPNFVSQLNLLNKSAELERQGLNKVLTRMGLKGFLSELHQLRPALSQRDHNTSNTHVQVDSVLKSFNYETLMEHFINPYIIDIYIPCKNVIIEVDGPYHYATSINQRVNAILKRPVTSFPLQYSLNSRLKRRLLTKSGYKFINVPYHEWPQSTNEQIYYISSLKI